MATRLTPDSAFGTPTPPTSLNDPIAEDSDPWFSLDGSRVYFSSTRNGSSDIYTALRP
jgi:Tol biopolymer transport system component